MYEAKMRFEWEQTARICAMWAKPGTKPDEFMPKQLTQGTPRIKLDGKAAMAALESVFGGKSR